MDCLRSFSFKISGITNAGGAEIITWGVAPQNYWIYASSALSSTYTIEGFKNVNIYKIEAVGDVASGVGSLNSVIVNDWAFEVQIQGQNQAIIGKVEAAPNTFNMAIEPLNPRIILSRFNTDFEFASPIQSAKSISITKLNARGIGAQNLALLNIGWNMTFTVYYNFEGE